MKKTTAIGALGLLALSGTGSALADGKGGLIGWLTGSREFPPIDNPTYLAECAGCHVAFPPGMMSAEDWQRVMNTLKNHYGDDATVKPAAAQTVMSYLRANAGRGAEDFAPHETAGKTPAGRAPRLTETVYFHRRHHEISLNYVKSNGKIKSFANCQACHKDAAEATYSEAAVTIPPLDEEPSPSRANR